MKGRPKNTRIISSIPTVSGFKPYGVNVNNHKSSSVFLNYEEYEAIRLNDYEKHTQCESAAIMGVSRPTFTRIYMCAREKTAKAFVEGSRIIIEGGKVKLNDKWRICKHCGAIFSPNVETDIYCCTLCGSDDVDAYDENKEYEMISKETNICGNRRCGGNRCGRRRYFNNKE